jgi:hypothetical protein
LSFGRKSFVALLFKGQSLGPIYVATLSHARSSSHAPTILSRFYHKYKAIDALTRIAKKSSSGDCHGKFQKQIYKTIFQSLAKSSTFLYQRILPHKNHVDLVS